MVRIIEKEISIKEPQKKENWIGKWKPMGTTSIDKIYFEIYYDAVRGKISIVIIFR